VIPCPETSPPGSFEISARCGSARAGYLTTSSGVIETPAFMPVGTQGTVKGISPRELAEEDYRCILGNTYHLMVRPGLAILKEMGGLHRFAGWDRAMLTDSGGFQVFSLAGLRKVTDEGAHFKSHVDGAPFFLGPREALDAQAILGSDIAMLFDECPPWPAERSAVAEAVRRTLQWAEVARSHETQTVHGRKQLRFAIVQGGSYPDLRRECAEALAGMKFDGYAIGGVSVGEPENEMYEAVSATVPYLPEERPHYAMGLGQPHQVVEMVARGVDMFDCVLPTRLARNGTAFTRRGMRPMENSEAARDQGPIEAGCACYACQNFSSAYIRHLLKAKEILGIRLVSLHNLHFYAQLMRDIRRELRAGTFEVWARSFQSDFLHNQKKRENL
jgi:queuine tRNA-ribosyltransferase